MPHNTDISVPFNKEVTILSTTDGLHVGKKATTDLFTLLVEGVVVEFTGRLHVGNGRWKCWNPDYTVDFKENVVNG